MDSSLLTQEVLRKPPPLFPDSHAATFLTLLPCFPFSLLTSAIFVCVCVCERERERERETETETERETEREREVDRGSGCSGSLPRSKKRLSLTLSSRTCSSSTAHYVHESVSLDTNYFTGKQKKEMRWDEMRWDEWWVENTLEMKKKIEEFYQQWRLVEHQDKQSYFNIKTHLIQNAHNVYKCHYSSLQCHMIFQKSF